MSDFDGDDRELDVFKRNLELLAHHFPTKAKQLMGRAGNVAKKMVLRKAKESVIEDKGNYFRSIKRGKVWVDQVTGEYKVRVYSANRHAHLLEYGHRMVGHNPDKKELGFVLGFHIFDKAGKEINDEWHRQLMVEFDKLLEKL